MEELIDPGQQAEFFVVPGQDEAAIELLGARIRDGEGVSPLPYLKPLESHQRPRRPRRRRAQPQGVQGALQRVRADMERRSRFRPLRLLCTTRPAAQPRCVPCQPEAHPQPEAQYVRQVVSRIGQLAQHHPMLAP